MTRRTTILAPAQPTLVSRENAQFHAPGPLNGPRVPDGPYPVFDGGDVFEVWAGLTLPSDVDITLGLLVYREPNPLTPHLFASFTIPAGTSVIAFACDHRVERGQRIAFNIGMTGGSTGFGLLLIARIA